MPVFSGEAEGDDGGVPHHQEPEEKAGTGGREAQNKYAGLVHGQNEVNVCHWNRLHSPPQHLQFHV